MNMDTQRPKMSSDPCNSILPSISHKYFNPFTLRIHDGKTSQAFYKAKSRANLFWGILILIGLILIDLLKV